MKTIRTITISILTIGLLAGSAVGVTAQEGGEAAYVTGTIAVSGGECSEAADWVECPLRLDASDSRLSGEGAVRSAASAMRSDDGLVVLVTMSLRIANDEGAWPATVGSTPRPRTRARSARTSRSGFSWVRVPMRV